MTAPQPFVFSIRPEYTAKILDGSKVWEFRTRRPRVLDGDLILIYETAPLQRIVGTAVVDRIMTGDKHWVWRTAQRKGVRLEDYEGYFKSQAEAVALHLSDVRRIVPRPLPEGMGPPQSWSRYKGVWS